MARIKHINCPKCGGTLGMSGMDRVVKCRYCSTWSLVDFADQTPEYYVSPKLSETDARRVLQGMLRDKDMPEGLIKKAQLHKASLFFIPYHELTGRRLGTMIVTQFKATRKPSVSPHYASSAELRGEFGLSPSERNSLIPKEKSVDTKVVMSDMTRLDPAVNLPDWGLEESEINAIRSDPAGMLRPMDRKKMERIGRVYDASVSPDQMLAKMTTTAETKWLEDDTEAAEVRVKRVYYPVWRVKYKYQGRIYGSSIDGVTGKLMAGRAPQSDRSRVLWMLGTTAIVSLVAGLISRSILLTVLSGVLSSGGGSQMMSMSVNLAFVFLIAAMFATVFLAFGWEQFRYPGEIVITGDERTTEKINRPENPFSDKVISVLSNILGDSLKSRKRSIWD